jgi:hypothetical protein
LHAVLTGHTNSLLEIQFTVPCMPAGIFCHEALVRKHALQKGYCINLLISFKGIDSAIAVTSLSVTPSASTVINALLKGNSIR